MHLSQGLASPEGEKKERLGLCTLIFVDDDLIYDFCKSDTKTIVICQDWDKLLDTYCD